MPLRTNREQCELKVSYEHHHHHYIHQDPPAVPSSGTDSQNTPGPSSMALVSSTFARDPRSTVSNAEVDSGSSMPSPSISNPLKRKCSSSDPSNSNRVEQVQLGPKRTPRQKMVRLPTLPFRLEISEEDVRDPPPWAPISDDVDRLFREWHDCDHLIIQGVRIPLQCWADVYRGSEWFASKRESWARYKVRQARRMDFKGRRARQYRIPTNSSSISSKQLIVDVYERECNRDARRFWQRFSRPSKRSNPESTLVHMTFLEIVNQIRKDRQAQEADKVAKIRAALSPDQFASIFTYRKGNQYKVMSRNDVILRHFRRLQDKGMAPSVPGSVTLPTDDEIGEDEEIEEEG